MRLFTLLMGFVILSGCPAQVEQEATRAQANTRAALPRPASSVFVNGSAIAELSPGWPLLVSLELRHPAIGPSELRFAPLIRFALVGSTGRVELAAKGLNLPTEVRLTNDPSGGADLTWLIGAEETARFTPGKYELRATLDGDIGLGFAELNVRPPSDDPEWKAQRLWAWNKASREAPGISFPDAELEAALGAHPEHVGLLRLAGQRRETRGDRDAAAGFYQRALRAYEAQNPNAQEPPEFIQRALRRVGH
jgi:hypothetical protein